MDINKPENPHNTQWFCPNCGTKNNDIFCSNCGTKKPDDFDDSKAMTEDKRNFSNLNVNNVNKNYNQFENKSQQSNISRNKNSNFVKYVLTVAVVVIIGVLAGVFVYMHKNAEEASSSNVKTETVKSSDVTSSEVQTSSSSDANDTKSSNKDENNVNVDDARDKFTAFHQNITSHKLRDAYSCLSQDFQSKMTYDGWATGFNTTLSSIPNNIRVISQNDNRVEFSYDLISRDKVNDGIKVQNFAGTTILIKENGHWVIDSITANKQGEHME